MALPKSIEFAVDKFIVTKNMIIFFYRVEMEKEEMLVFKHFLPFPTMFSQASSAELNLSQTSPDFYLSAVQVFQKLCWKWRNSRNTNNFFFPTVFSTQ